MPKVRALLTLAGAVILASATQLSVNALSPASSGSPEGLLLASGKPVSKIAGVREIVDWQTLDDRHLLLELSPSRIYRLTLGPECHLPYAQTVGISRSEGTIWAGFDYVTADGKQCSIRRIEQL